MKHQAPCGPCRRYDFGDPEIPSLADVADTVRADPTLAKRRAQLLTSLGHLPIYLGLVPPGRRRNRAITDRGIAQTIEFNVTRMRKALSLADPVQHEVSRKTILNDRSNISFLLDHLDLGGMRRHLAPFTEELQHFFDALGDRYLQTNLSRLLHFIAAHQLRLENVDDKLARDFLDALARDALIKNHRVLHQNTCRAWNKAIEKLGRDDLRPLTVPRYRQPWAFPWTAFPSSLLTEIDRFYASSEGEVDIFDEYAPDFPLKPRTVKTQKDLLRVLVSAAVRAGAPIEELTSLTELVRPERYKLALTWLVEQRNGKPNSYLSQVAYVGRKIAHHGSDLSPAELKQVEKLYTRIRTRASQHKAPTKRFERLKQFESRKNMLRLLALSARAEKAVTKRESVRQEDALEIQLALVHEILLATSMRRQNVAALDLSRHFTWLGSTDMPVCRIRVEADETKNDVVIDKELPLHVIKLLQLYLDRYRGELTDTTNSFLFPGRGNAHKSPSGLAQQYRGFVKRWTGLDVTMHLIRSLTDKIYTDKHPEGGEVVRRQLAHKSAQTRVQYYADPRSRAANKAYLETLLEERDNALRFKDELF